jgi:hypothetical protein
VAEDDDDGVLCCFCQSRKLKTLVRRQNGPVVEGQCVCVCV